MTLIGSPTNFVHTLWFIELPDGDFFGFVHKEDGDPEWRLNYRFRHYDGDQSKDCFDDGDTKRWFIVKHAEVDRLLSMARLCVTGAKAFYGSQSWEVAVNGYGDAVVAVLHKLPWAHWKTVNHDGTPIATQNTEGTPTCQ